MKQKAIVFDFDDTLVEYREIFIESHRAIAKKLGLRVPDETELTSQLGKPWDNILSSVWPGVDHVSFKQENYKYLKGRKRKSLKNALEVLKKLKQEQYKLYILSSRQRERIHEILNEVGIPKNLFMKIYGKEDTTFYKPDARVFNPLLEHYHPNELVYVGPTLIDEIAAKNAGIEFIGVGNNFFGKYISGIEKLPFLLDITNEPVAEMPTKYGTFLVKIFTMNNEQIVALMKGTPQERSLVRLHSGCLTSETLFSKRCDCADQLKNAMKRIQEKGNGVILHLDQEGRGIGLLEKIKAYYLQDHGFDTQEANFALGHKSDLRDYSNAGLVLERLGIQSLDLMTNNPLKIQKMQEMGFKVNRVAHEVEPTKENKHYLLTKKIKNNHMLTKI